MENILDRFLRYVAIDTQSDENSETQPSTAKQLDLQKVLCEELRAMGIEAPKALIFKLGRAIISPLNDDQ